MAPKPAKEATSTTPPVSHPKEPSDNPKAASPDTPDQTDESGPDTPKHRRRRTIGPKDPPPRDEKPKDWQIQKDALRKKFPLGWAPPKKLSPDALSGLRALHAQFPETYTTPVLSGLFEVSPEAVRRILKSKWSPVTSEGEEDRRQRWVRRGERVWERWAGLGVKVPRSWRPEGTSKWGGKVQRPREEGEEVVRPGQGVEKGPMTPKKTLNGGSRARRNVTKRIM